MDRGRRFRFRYTLEDADDAPVFIAHAKSTSPWRCAFHCGHLNPASADACQTCGQPKPEHLQEEF